MADLTGTPAYVNKLRQLEPTDPAHPNTWNPNYQSLLNNDAFLKQLVETLSQTLTSHTGNKNNPHGVTASQIGAATASHTHSANDLPKGSTSGQGIVQLTDSISSDSKTLAATASAVKTAMDRANEAFTQAGNGKSSIATAVTAKGVSASPADTFAELAKKIGQINTGKKWAVGNVTRIQGTTTPVVVAGLNFAPSIVVMQPFYNGKPNTSNKIYVTSTGEIYKVNRIRSGALDYIVINLNGFSCAVNMPNYDETDFMWIAFE